MIHVAAFQGTLKIEKGLARVLAVVDGNSRLVLPLVGRFPSKGIFETRAILYRFGQLFALHLRQLDKAGKEHHARLSGTAGQIAEAGAAINETGAFDAEWLALQGNQFFVGPSRGLLALPDREAPPVDHTQGDRIEIVEETAPVPGTTTPPTTSREMAISSGDLPPQEGSVPAVIVTPAPEPNVDSGMAIGLPPAITIIPQIQPEPFPVTDAPHPLLHGPSGSVPHIQAPLTRSGSGPSPATAAPTPPTTEATTPARKGRRSAAPARRPRPAEARPGEPRPVAGITSEEIERFAF